jgi:hypothetical protein
MTIQVLIPAHAVLLFLFHCIIYCSYCSYASFGARLWSHSRTICGLAAKQRIVLLQSQSETGASRRAKGQCAHVAPQQYGMVCLGEAYDVHLPMPHCIMSHRRCEQAAGTMVVTGVAQGLCIWPDEACTQCLAGMLRPVSCWESVPQYD